MPSLTAIVGGIPLREGAVREVLQVFLRVGLRYADGGHARQGRGIQLLEVVQGLGDGFAADGGDGGQPDRHAADGGDGIVQQLFGVQARHAFDLGDHLVGARLDAE